MRGLGKETRALLAIAISKGCTVRRTKGGHVIVTSPAGERVTLSGTPGGGRAMRNARADMKRKGMI